MEAARGSSASSTLMLLAAFVFAASSLAGPPSTPPVEDPAPRAPAERVALVGSVVGPFTFTDTRWHARTLEDLGSATAYVIVFTTIDCPVARRTLPALAELERVWRARGVRFLAVDVGPGDPLVEVAARGVEAGVEFPLARDFSGEVAAALAPRRVPEVVVLDPRRTVRYRGRVDASQRLGGPVPGDVRADLALAIEEVVAGRVVTVATTPVEGCAVTRADEPPPRVVPDWAEVVGPIVHARCGACHAIGGSAPFEIVTYDGARRHAATIAEVVAEQRMPPWFASREHGDFVNAPRMSDGERRAVRAWAENGTPSGDAALAPEPPRAPTGPDAWRIGAPDLVLSTGPIALPATGTVPYRYVVLPHVFTRDTWIEAIEIRPSDRAALHHANLGWYQVGGDVTAQNFITGQVPGGDPMVLGEGVAVLVPAGAVLALQIHHVTTGVPTADTIDVALRFPRAPVQQRLRLHEISEGRFAIPPFAPAHEVRAERRFERAAVGVGMFVHMHVRGRDMRFVARAPGRPDETLLFVPNYDFDWQMAYRWKAGARRFEKGTVVECIAHFDNSAFNPWNPDPKRTVRFGLETVDEMMYGFLFYVDADERLGIDIDPATGVARASAAR